MQQMGLSRDIVEVTYGKKFLAEVSLFYLTNLIELGWMLDEESPYRPRALDMEKWVHCVPSVLQTSVTGPAVSSCNRSAVHLERLSFGIRSLKRACTCRASTPLVGSWSQAFVLGGSQFSSRRPHPRS
jgi:hypothetical protein